ncbi:hypothetical protein CGMCC3_g9677 [Colletotrichum fructicola]|nr:uncharacterized protein CGMCC3_g9677 [Colletotrichum fructicola]KAE9574235.1 hypothetical protein CGMCC3_g9677 [Colletotrichum fructicola]
MDGKCLAPFRMAKCAVPGVLTEAATATHWEMPGEMPRWRGALTAAVGAEAPWKPGLLRAERSAEAAAGASRVDLRQGQLDEKASPFTQ